MQHLIFPIELDGIQNPGSEVVMVGVELGKPSLDACPRHVNTIASERF